jgi:ribosomal protein S18 acetylase RimI-like enzyme
MAPGLIRAFNIGTDAAAVARLDTSFSTQRIYQVERIDDVLSLRSVPIAAAVEKRFPLDLSADSWQSGWVIVLGEEPVGLIATAAQQWNKRLVIWHFYVDRPWRQHGFGRRLVEQALTHGAAIGMLTAWVETSNLNFPAVRAYRRLGFEICGFDESLYRGTPVHREFALFLARPINGGVAPSIG